MKKPFLSLRLLAGLIAAHLLLYFSFQEKVIFWYIFTASILVLIVIAMYQGEVEDEASFSQYLFIGAVSGVLMYICFSFGLKIMEWLHPSFSNEVKKLYKWYAPKVFWEYLALIIVAAPGEEMFWRGFIQRKLIKQMRPVNGIITASILYASVHIYSHSLLLILAALISGLVWGFFYQWKRSMPLVIVSHIVFDMLIFMFIPLK